jgi:3'(2'), 5'-bisphosphate nucleotidase
MNISSNAMLELALIAEEAGRAIMQIYERQHLWEIDMKSDASPLTQADLQANEIIVAALGRLDPEIPVLSEESPWLGGNAATYWAVDPLDGTKEFIKRNGEFTVNIALIENGTPILGVVHAPALQETWSGLCIGSDPRATKRTMGEPWRVIRVAEKNPKQTNHERIKVVGSRSHATPNWPNWLKNLLGDYELVECGSSLKFCYVADGRADVYPRLGPTCIWDTAAGHAVVTAAGGRVINAETMETLRYLDPRETLNPNFVVLPESLFSRA